VIAAFCLRYGKLLKSFILKIYMTITLKENQGKQETMAIP